MKCSLRTAPAALALLVLPTIVSLQGQALFEDNFDTDTSANWSIFTGYYEGLAADDYKLEWAIDYSKVTYNFFTDPITSTERTVPPAPNSTNGTTRGLRISVNKNDDEAGRFAINLYPKGKTFSGNFVLKFDAFMNHAAYYDGGVGTTEYTLFGINHGADRVNWGALASGQILQSFTESAVGRNKSDGLWFGFTGDGGAAQDWWTWEGVNDGPSKYLAGVTGGVGDHNADGTADLNEFDGYNAVSLPSPPYEAAGVPGKRWVQVELSQINDVITWKLDGQVMARRTNSSAWKSGDIMVGYCDPFAGIAAARDENWVILDNIRVEPVAGRTLVVDTADNDSPATDGKTSLKEALAGLQSYDTVTFNIPGNGPHLIKTPIGGYPLVTQNNVTIDGYSQPGSSPNTLNFNQGNNAVLQVVLDSTGNESSGDPAKPDRRSTRLPYPGYGDSENAILGVLEADDVTIKGLSFLSRHTPGSDEDPSIYCVALVKGALNCHVQGCWFGLSSASTSPSAVPAQGSAAAVAAFRHRVQDEEGVDVDTFSDRLVVGTDSDGIDDLAEPNVICGMHISLALELPMARIAGNYFNVMPDGNTFIDVEKIFQAQVDAGREVDDSSVENLENGRVTDSSVIGTDGNGINDANERNLFNYAVYDQLLEFYSSALGCVVAGNYFGLGINGTSAPPVPTLLKPNLISMPGSASLRLGSNGDGVSDAIEGNIIHAIPGPLLVDGAVTVPITARLNQLLDNQFETFVFPNEGDRAYDKYYVDVLVDPTLAIPVLESYTSGILSGKGPASIRATYPSNVVDVYVADPQAFARQQIVPGTYLGTFVEGSEKDLNPAEDAFQFDLSGLSVPAGAQLVVAITYSKLVDDPATNAGKSVTGPVSNAVATPGQGGITVTTIVKDGANVKLTWAGGAPPYKLQGRPNLATGNWTDVLTTSELTATVPASGPAEYFRVAGSQ